MKSLYQLQQQFQSYILQKDEAILDTVDTTHVQAAKQRLNTYQNNYYAGLQEALEDDFPITQRYLGTQIFEKLCMDYIKTHPSHAVSLSSISETWPAFLKTALPQNPVASELAQLELASIKAYAAKSSPALTQADLAQFPPEQWGQLQFQFHPSVIHLNLYTNASAILEAYMAETSPPEIETYEHPEHCLVWRDQGTPRFWLLHHPQAEVVLQLQSGSTFGQACDTVAETHETNEAVQIVAQLLSELLENGLLSQVKRLV